MSVLLAVQGGLIMLGAILIGIFGTSVFPVDNIVGSDASVAALVLGVAFLFAFRTPTRNWVNLAILYNALTLIAGLLRWTQGFGVRLSPAAMAVSVLFMVAFLVSYPRGEAAQVAPASSPA